MAKTKNIIIIGSGKVASQLAQFFAKNNKHFIGIWGRNSEKATLLAKSLQITVLEDLKNISHRSLVIVCVSDDAIHAVLQEIPTHVPVAYTSGSVQLTQLPKREKLGVFYPLQTFSEGRKIDLSNVPFLIESNHQEFAEELFNLASSVSKNVLFANSKQRFHIHIAAVMVNNFSNLLFGLAKDFLAQHHLDFNILLPLIEETGAKLADLSPEKSQTGPAIRGDEIVIQKHLDAIDNEDVKEIYQLMSKLIQKRANPIKNS